MIGDVWRLINCFFEFDFAIVFAFVAESKRATFAFAAGSATNLACNVVVIESDAEAFHAMIIQAIENESTKKERGSKGPAPHSFLVPVCVFVQMIQRVDVGCTNEFVGARIEQNESAELATAAPSHGTYKQVFDVFWDAMSITRSNSFPKIVLATLGNARCGAIVEEARVFNEGGNDVVLVFVHEFIMAAFWL